MADPRVYCGVVISILIYLMCAPSSRAKEPRFQTPPPEMPVTQTGADRMMQVMRFASQSDKPLYRMTPKEIRDRSRYY